MLVNGESQALNSVQELSVKYCATFLLVFRAKLFIAFASDKYNFNFSISGNTWREKNQA